MLWVSLEDLRECYETVWSKFLNDEDCFLFATQEEMLKKLREGSDMAIKCLDIEIIEDN